MDPLPSLLTAKNDEAGRVVLTSRWRLQKAYTTAGKQNASPEGLAQVLDFLGRPCGIRTCDQRIKSPRESLFFGVEQYAAKPLNDGKTREKLFFCIA